MALPKEPRQKMINLMYLVLMAMLALNVSAEILNAFKTVNESINNSNQAISQKNNLVYQQFEKQLSIDPERVRPIKEKADQVRMLCQQMNQYIDSLKKVIIRESGGLNDSGEIKDMSNLDAPSRVMENQGQGPILEKKIQTLREQLLSMYDNPVEREEVAQILPLKIEMPKKTIDNKKTWTQVNFEMVPTIAAITILSKIQNDVKNSEAQVIDDLFKKIGQQEFVFDTYKPLISANAGYVIAGQKYEAQIMLGAYSSTINPTITVNGQPIPVQNGVGTFSTVASGVGLHTYNVAISLKDQSGQIKTYTATAEYMVGAPAVSVSADKMNVLYIGVDNPISVAVAGVPAERVSASISGPGSLIKSGPGKYIARVSAVGTVTVNVSAEFDGQVRPMGSMEFRTKRIPDPVAEVAGSKGGTLSAAVFKVQKGVAAVLENFDFDAKFVVTSFTIGFDGAGFSDYIEANSNSAYFTDEIEKYIQRCRPGTRVFIDNIHARGPDGTTRLLPPISFKLN
ncbi:MAG: gliding motility protein GldM [Thermoflavifilum sp.]|uniref:type IX secretion system motor protein PorM/GldM n=1 Tax=Thermoflavifilum sp. TaxID=1968839 RepID=UPI0018A450A2|nr:gliding motility protein GldM [Thermoflavifilum sp.]QOR76841.1 MAG: gliding motility protein GldM [Thermoflavifilum sp.]